MKKISLRAMAFAVVMVLFLPVMMPMKAEAATFADGEYSVPFTVLKDNSNEQSTTADYMVSPAKVQLVNDKATVTVTLKNSSWWQYFKVQNGGSFSDVQVVSESGDTRVVRFTVSDLTKVVNAKIHIIVTGIPGFDYDNKYDIRFNFNTSSIPAPPVEKPVTTPPPAKETKPETPKKTEEKPVQKTPEKKSEQTVVKKNENATTKENQKVIKESEKDTTEQSDKKSEEQAEVKTEADKSDEASESEQAEDEEDAVVTEESEMLEDEALEEIVAEEVKDEAEDSSNRMTFIIILIVTAVVVAGIVFAFAKKRVRK
ncbi:NEAT domain-containing protein [Sporosarcina sp. USHLN248]|uniref:NEAT domain-containing protein n=1 Tax=Sporosarcina sp. USHLN248 TaxID=3081300 RepID=UPI0030187CEF